ncbi:hypothetical protein MMC34_003965 [Xylographa carneopallida]|nr:hypothetical protein [Xylographa carneopallida]
MPRPTTPLSPRTEAPTLLPSALPKDLSSDSTTTQIPPSPTTEPPATEPASQPFNPFFTLIEDAHSPTTHHPTVHYIFSDDDPDLLTNALLHIHDSQAAQAPSTQSRGPGSPPRVDQDTQERYVLLNLAASGTAVDSVHSLTGDWQVLSAEIGKAPTLEGGGGEGGLMLRIEGTEGSKAEGVECLGLEGLVETFGRRMGQLRRVVEGGGG